MMHYRRRTLRVQGTTTILHLVGNRGVYPGDHAVLVRQGYVVAKIQAIDTKMVFTYARKM